MFNTELMIFLEFFFRKMKKPWRYEAIILDNHPAMILYWLLQLN